MEQSVSSSLPTLQKRKVGEKNTSEKPNGLCGITSDTMKQGKVKNVEMKMGVVKSRTAGVTDITLKRKTRAICASQGPLQK